MKVAHKKNPKTKKKEEAKTHFKLELNGEDGTVSLSGSANEMAGRIASLMLQVPQLAPVLLKAADIFLSVVEKQEQNEPEKNKP